MNLKSDWYVSDLMAVEKWKDYFIHFQDLLISN